MTTHEQTHGANGHGQEPTHAAPSKASYSKKQKVGLIAFALLMVTELVEYAVGSTIKHGTWPVLVVLAVLGAWPILHYFMHMSQLWHKGEEE